MSATLHRVLLGALVVAVIVLSSVLSGPVRIQSALSAHGPLKQCPDAVAASPTGKTLAKSTVGDASDDTILREWPADDDDDASCQRWLRIAGTQGAGFQLARHDDIAQPLDISSKYKVFWCQAPKVRGARSGTDVYFRLVKLRDCGENVTGFLKNRSYEQFVRESYGPDEFSLVLEGLEVLALQINLKYVGHCRYAMSGAVTVPGRYRVNLVAIRENYIGFREMAGGQPFLLWPPSHYDLPLGDHTFIEVGGDNPPSKRTGLLLQALSGEGLPLCNVWSPGPFAPHIRGRWVRLAETADNVFLSPPEPIELEGAEIVRHIDPDQYTWRPYDCKLKQFTREQAVECLQDKLININGDSQLRHLFDALINFACGWSRKGLEKKCVGNEHGKCSRTQSVCFTNDADGSMKGTKFGDFTVVIFNSGQHPADGRHHYTLDAYEKLVKFMFSEAKIHKSPVWHENNILRYRADHWVRSYTDWRTSSRLRLFNYIAQKRMAAFPIIPTYAQTAAFAMHVTDPAHWPDAQLIASSVQHVLNLLCPSANSSAIDPRHIGDS